MGRLKLNDRLLTIQLAGYSHTSKHWTLVIAMPCHTDAMHIMPIQCSAHGIHVYANTLSAHQIHVYAYVYATAAQVHDHMHASNASHLSRSIQSLLVHALIMIIPYMPARNVHPYLMYQSASIQGRSWSSAPFMIPRQRGVYKLEDLHWSCHSCHRAGY